MARYYDREAEREKRIRRKESKEHREKFEHDIIVYGTPSYLETVANKTIAHVASNPYRYEDIVKRWYVDRIEMIKGKRCCCCQRTCLIFYVVKNRDHGGELFVGDCCKLDAHPEFIQPHFFEAYLLVKENPYITLPDTITKYCLEQGIIDMPQYLKYASIREASLRRELTSRQDYAIKLLNLLFASSLADQFPPDARLKDLSTRIIKPILKRVNGSNTYL